MQSSPHTECSMICSYCDNNSFFKKKDRLFNFHKNQSILPESVTVK